MGVNVDRVFSVDHFPYADPVWQGNMSGMSVPGSGFSGCMELIAMSERLLPGPYLVVRLDHTSDPNKLPDFVWIGIVHDDQSVTMGLSQDANVRLTTWPPKKVV